MEKNKIIRSSVDSTKVSLTIKGIAVAIILTLIFIAGLFGFSFVEADLTELVNAIATLVSAGFIVYGLVRKAVVNFKKNL